MGAETTAEALQLQATSAPCLEGKHREPRLTTQYDAAADKLLEHIARRSRQDPRGDSKPPPARSTARRTTIHVVINRPRECTFVLGDTPGTSAPTTDHHES